MGQLVFFKECELLLETALPSVCRAGVCLALILLKEVESVTGCQRRVVSALLFGWIFTVERQEEPASSQAHWVFAAEGPASADMFAQLCLTIG